MAYLTKMTSALSICLLLLSITNVGGDIMQLADFNTLASDLCSIFKLTLNSSSAQLTAIKKVLPTSQSQPPLTATTPSYITDQGYKVESHYITTPDGYILNVFRIPQGKTQQYDSSRIPVIIHHGLQCTSDAWVGSGPGSLAFAVADQGYDVWLGNYRGNEYSSNSTQYSPLNPVGPFWQFSFDQSTQYDATAYINYITNVTGHQKMIWIGHSMGTTVPLALLSSIDEYNDRLLGFIAMAPVSRIRYGIPSLFQIAELTSLLDTVYTLVGSTSISSNILPNNILVKTILTSLCPAQDPTLCLLLVDLLLGVETSDNFNKSFVPNAFCQFPGGGSLQQVLHYLQGPMVGTFSKMNFLALINEEKYGQTTVPLYNMSNIRTPTYIIWSDNDALAHPLDVAWMRPQIPSLKATAKVESLTYTHADFMWSYRNAEVLNPIVFQFLDDIVQKATP